MTFSLTELRHCNKENLYRFPSLYSPIRMCTCLFRTLTKDEPLSKAHLLISFFLLSRCYHSSLLKNTNSTVLSSVFDIFFSCLLDHSYQHESMYLFLLTIKKVLHFLTSYYPIFFFPFVAVLLKMVIYSCYY